MCTVQRCIVCGSSAALLFALLADTGCDVFQPAPGAQQGSANRQPRLSPVLQRMQKSYEDLASGRFISLADFESPGQETMFRCAGADGKEGSRQQPTLSILRSRNETGAGGLKARLLDAGDRLLFDGKRSTAMALVRDWRPYGLLLMSIYGPPQGVRLEFSIESGEQLPLRWSRTIQVKPGWNLFRIDVATVGDRIDLGDVRALAWRAPPITAPTELYLDDLILADNTRHLLGEPAGPGELYVFTRGRRICVGARARFELAFADGQIVGWRSGDDENLADVDGLGPWPVPLAQDWFERQEAALAYDDPQLFTAWGATVATTQRVVEATAFRVVVEGRWRFADPTAASSTREPDGDVGPGHVWRYVIYPSGQVHVRARSHAPVAGWGELRVGYAIGLDGRRDFRRVEPPVGDTQGDAVEFVLMGRPGGQRADLLWTWPRTTGLNRQRELASADERRLAVIVGDVEAASMVETAQLFRIWPPDIDAVPEALSFAADYRRPAVLTATAGRPLTDVEGDLDHDGYNESEGCYELAPTDRVLRFDFDPGRHLRFDPVFRVHETAGRRCWVYARGRLVATAGRDADDNLLFLVGRVASKPLAVEVHTASE